MWQNRKKGSAFRSWQLLVRLQQADRKAEKYWKEKNSSETVIEWHEWAVNQKVWRVMILCRFYVKVLIWFNKKICRC